MKMKQARKSRGKWLSRVTSSRRGRLWLLGFLSSGLVAALGQSPPSPGPPNGAPPNGPAEISTVTGRGLGKVHDELAAETDARYRIGPGDVLNIQIFNRPQLSREAVRVDGRGLIRMPWIEGEIVAACRTETEVAAEITSRYRPLLRAPQVGVFVREYQSQPVAVIGAVNQPGRFQLQRRLHLLELLAFAGGPSERAGRSVQIIHAAPMAFCEQFDPPSADSNRDAAPAASSAPTASANTITNAERPPAAQGAEPAGRANEVLTSLTLSEVMRGREEANPVVHPGDIVTLPEAEQVFVVGNVLRPAPVPMRQPLTVSQAIAMAGGILQDSKSDRVRVVRQTPEGKKEIFVNLKAIDKRGAEDLVLQANDIVNVPTAGGKSFARTVINALAPTVSQLPLRMVY